MIDREPPTAARRRGASVMAWVHASEATGLRRRLAACGVIAARGPGTTAIRGIPARKERKENSSEGGQTSDRHGGLHDGCTAPGRLSVAQGRRSLPRACVSAGRPAGSARSGGERDHRAPALWHTVDRAHGPAPRHEQPLTRPAAQRAENELQGADRWHPPRARPALSGAGLASRHPLAPRPLSSVALRPTGPTQSGTTCLHSPQGHAQTPS